MAKVVVTVVLCWIFNELSCSFSKQKTLPGMEDYLINTTGCYLPNYGKTVDYGIKEKYKLDCVGQRIVFVKKVTDTKIRFKINYDKYIRGSILKCCYSFVRRSSRPGYEDKEISYSECKYFEHNETVSLEEEIFAVKCIDVTNILVKSHKFILDKLNPFKKADLVAYKDVYVIIKKKPRNEEIRLKGNDKENHWNILLLGMDSMSRVRVYTKMPKLFDYLHKNRWLDYRGYHKTAENTFPNVMSLLTGKHYTEVFKDCADGMESCRHLMIWNTFKDAGYVTAYGEDTQSPIYYSYKYLNASPTDHFLRPLLLTGEYGINNTLWCIANKPSIIHLLNFAVKFAKTYEDDRFFGFFWTSTFSHDPVFTPSAAQDMFINTFKYLRYIGILKNTFVFFIGDHGVNYGVRRKSKELYFDGRLPMLFMWVPKKFRQIHPDEYRNLRLNQHRLTTNFDLHATLWRIVKMGNTSVRITPPEACPSCWGLTKHISQYRTCQDANIEEYWCSCHDMTEVADKNELKQSVNAVMAYIENKINTTVTSACMKCSPLIIKKVLWNLRYRRGKRKYIVIVFEVNLREAAYEAKVEVYKNNFSVIEPVIMTSSFKFDQQCVSNYNYYCHCVAIKCWSVGPLID